MMNQMDIVINNLNNNFNNHAIITHPIEQIVKIDSISIPVVDGYIFNGWDKEFVIIYGQITNESNWEFDEEIVPIGKPVVVGRPIFPPWALRVCVISGRPV